MKIEACKQIIAEWLEEFEFPELVPRRIPSVNLTTLTRVLAIVGPRRAGKTYFMYQLAAELMEHSGFGRDDILWVDFEDYRLIDFSPTDFDVFLTAFNQLTGKSPKFLFLDEAQHIPQWSRVLRTLHNRKKYRIVISGSNSELLGREIASELRGRYRDELMLPFSFREMLAMRKVDYSERTFYTSRRGALLKAFDEYLAVGGFPEILRETSATERKKLLQTYFQSVFYRDIVERYNVRTKYLLEAMMDYCLSNFSNLFSISRFEKELRSLGLPGSKRTVSNYLNYLKEAFFIILNDKFSYSARKRVLNPKKLYLLDVGFCPLGSEFTENKGRVLENVVAIELIRRGEEVFYHKGKKECDFVVKRGRKLRQAVQVCRQLDRSTEPREMAGLVEAMTSYGINNGLVLTYEDEGKTRYKGKSIQILPVWKWLLGGKQRVVKRVSHAKAPRTRASTVRGRRRTQS